MPSIDNIPDPSEAKVMKALRQSPFTDMGNATQYSRRRAPSPQKTKQQELFERVSAAAQLAHMRGFPLEPAAVQAQDEELTLPEVYKVMGTPLFMQSMEDRGIPTSPSKRLTRQQLDVIRLLSDTSSPKTERERVKAAGVPWPVFLGWLDYKPFADLYSETSTGALRKSIAPARVKLAEAMQRGSAWAIKYGFEVTGEHNPAAAQDRNIELFMSAFQTILMKHITDPEKLIAIGMELERLSDRTAIPVMELEASPVYDGGDPQSQAPESDVQKQYADPEPESAEPGDERAALDGDR